MWLECNTNLSLLWCAECEQQDQQNIIQTGLTKYQVLHRCFHVSQIKLMKLKMLQPLANCLGRYTKSTYWITSFILCRAFVIKILFDTEYKDIVANCISNSLKVHWYIPTRVLINALFNGWIVLIVMFVFLFSISCLTSL